MMDQLISHFHEFRKEFLAQCEVFRAQLQASSEYHIRNSVEIQSIQKDIEAMQKELNKIHFIAHKKNTKGGLEILTNPIFILALVVVLLVFLISDLNVKKENGLLDRAIEALPGVKEKRGER